MSFGGIRFVIGALDWTPEAQKGVKLQSNVKREVDSSIEALIIRNNLNSLKNHEIRLLRRERRRKGSNYNFFEMGK